MASPFWSLVIDRSVKSPDDRRPKLEPATTVKLVVLRSRRSSVSTVPPMNVAAFNVTAPVVSTFSV